MLNAMYNCGETYMLNGSTSAVRRANKIRPQIVMKISTVMLLLSSVSKSFGSVPTTEFHYLSPDVFDKMLQSAEMDGSTELGEGVSHYEPSWVKREVQIVNGFLEIPQILYMPPLPLDSKKSWVAIAKRRRMVEDNDLTKMNVVSLKII